MFTIYPTGVPCQVDNIIFLYYFMREFFTIAIFKIKADIRMNKTTLNSQKEKHSLLSLRRATFVGLAAHRLRNISIHALLAESDTRPGGYVSWMCGFLSTLSLRRATVNPSTRSITSPFLSTLSLRRATCTGSASGRYNQFLSTLSLRRATGIMSTDMQSAYISIHALLAESDSERSTMTAVSV